MSIDPSLPGTNRQRPAHTPAAARRRVDNSERLYEAAMAWAQSECRTADAASACRLRIAEIVDLLGYPVLPEHCQVVDNALAAWADHLALKVKEAQQWRVCVMTSHGHKGWYDISFAAKELIKTQITKGSAGISFPTQDGLEVLVAMHALSTLVFSQPDRQIEEAM